MMVLYHGSPRKLTGEKLKPSWGDDSDERPDNKVWGVYASDLKQFAVTIALLQCRGVKGSVERFRKPLGTIYGGALPKQTYIYLHTLPAKTFTKSRAIQHQYISKRAVKPLATERLLVKDYLYLIRLAGKRESATWFAKYSGKNPSHVDKPSQI